MLSNREFDWLINEAAYAPDEEQPETAVTLLSDPRELSNLDLKVAPEPEAKKSLSSDTWKSLGFSDEDFIDLTPERSLSEELGVGLERGKDQTIGLGYGFVGLLGQAVGLEGVEEYGVENYLRKMEEAAMNQASVRDPFEEIDDLGDAGLYAAGIIGEQIPQLLASALGGGIGGLAAKTIGKRIVGNMIGKRVSAGLAGQTFASDAARVVATDKLRKEAAKEVAKETAGTLLGNAGRAGGVSGAYLANFGQISGGSFGQMAQELGRGDAGIAAGFAVPGAALDTLGEVFIASKFLKPFSKAQRAAAEGVDTSLGLGRIGGGAATGFAAGSAIEGGTEYVQTGLEQAALGAADPNRTIEDVVMTPEAERERRIAGAAGATVGGPLGGVGGGFEVAFSPRTTQALNDRSRQTPANIPGDPESGEQFSVIEGNWSEPKTLGGFDFRRNDAGQVAIFNPDPERFGKLPRFSTPQGEVFSPIDGVEYLNLPTKSDKVLAQRARGLFDDDEVGSTQVKRTTVQKPKPRTPATESVLDEGPEEISKAALARPEVSVVDQAAETAETLDRNAVTLLRDARTTLESSIGEIERRQLAPEAKSTLTEPLYQKLIQVEDTLRKAPAEATALDAEILKSKQAMADAEAERVKVARQTVNRPPDQSRQFVESLQPNDKVTVYLSDDQVGDSLSFGATFEARRANGNVVVVTEPDAEGNQEKLVFTPQQYSRLGMFKQPAPKRSPVDVAVSSVLGPKPTKAKAERVFGTPYQEGKPQEAFFDDGLYANPGKTNKVPGEVRYFDKEGEPGVKEVVNFGKWQGNTRGTLFTTVRQMNLGLDVPVPDDQLQNLPEGVQVEPRTMKNGQTANVVTKVVYNGNTYRRGDAAYDFSVNGENTGPGSFDNIYFNSPERLLRSERARKGKQTQKEKAGKTVGSVQSKLESLDEADQFFVSDARARAARFIDRRNDLDLDGKSVASDETDASIIEQVAGRDKKGLPPVRDLTLFKKFNSRMLDIFESNQENETGADTGRDVQEAARQITEELVASGQTAAQAAAAVDPIVKRWQSYGDFSPIKTAMTKAQSAKKAAVRTGRNQRAAEADIAAGSTGQSRTQQTPAERFVERTSDAAMAGRERLDRVVGEDRDLLDAYWAEETLSESDQQRVEDLLQYIQGNKTYDEINQATQQGSAILSREPRDGDNLRRDAVAEGRAGGLAESRGRGRNQKGTGRGRNRVGRTDDRQTRTVPGAAPVAGGGLGLGGTPDQRNASTARRAFVGSFVGDRGLVAGLSEAVVEKIYQAVSTTLDALAATKGRRVVAATEANMADLMGRSVEELVAGYQEEFSSYMANRERIDAIRRNAQEAVRSRIFEGPKAALEFMSQDGNRPAFMRLIAKVVLSQGKRFGLNIDDIAMQVGIFRRNFATQPLRGEEVRARVQEVQGEEGEGIFEVTTPDGVEEYAFGGDSGRTRKQAGKEARARAFDLVTGQTRTSWAGVLGVDENATSPVGRYSVVLNLDNWHEADDIGLTMLHEIAHVFSKTKFAGLENLNAVEKAAIKGIEAFRVRMLKAVARTNDLEVPASNNSTTLAQLSRQIDDLSNPNVVGADADRRFAYLSNADETARGLMESPEFLKLALQLGLGKAKTRGKKTSLSGPVAEAWGDIVDLNSGKKTAATSPLANAFEDAWSATFGALEGTTEGYAKPPVGANPLAQDLAALDQATNFIEDQIIARELTGTTAEREALLQEFMDQAPRNTVQESETADTVVDYDVFDDPVTMSRGVAPQQDSDFIQIGKFDRVTGRDESGNRFAFFGKLIRRGEINGESVTYFRETTSDGNEIFDTSGGNTAERMRIVQSSFIKKIEPMALSKTYGEYQVYRPETESRALNENQTSLSNQGATNDTRNQPALQTSAEGMGSQGRGDQVQRQTLRPNAEPNPFVQDGVSAYNARYGLGEVVRGHYAPVDEQRARQIAALYDALPVLDEGRETQDAYRQLGFEIQQQWDFAINTMGVTFEPWTREGQPYANSREMVRDVRDSQHLWFFTGGEPHPLLNQPDENGLTINDKLRAIHDLFGHAAEDYQFGPRGEENAWIKHSQMFTPLAQRALTTETRGQNSWVNYGPMNYNPDGTRRTIPASERPFAEQKVALLPEEFMDWRTPLATESRALALRNPVIDPGAVAAAIREAGGITVDIWTATQPDTGFIVAPFKETETRISLNDFSPAAVRAFVQRFRDLLAVRGMHLGGWLSGPTVYLDASIVTNDQVLATLIAQDGNQLALFDRSNFTELSTADLSRRFSEALGRSRQGTEYQALARTLRETRDGVLAGIRGPGRADVPGQRALQERTDLTNDTQTESRALGLNARPIEFFYTQRGLNRENAARGAESLRLLANDAKYDKRRTAGTASSQYGRVEEFQRLVDYVDRNNLRMPAALFRKFTQAKDQVADGAEHTVYGDDRSGRVLKITHADFIKDGAVTPNSGANDYFVSLLLSREIFGIDTMFEGIVDLQDGSAPRVVTSQPKIQGKFAKPGKIAKELKARGFEKDGGDWVNTAIGVRISDAVSNNVLEDAQGKLHFIDVGVAPMRPVADIVADLDEVNGPIDRQGWEMARDLAGQSQWLESIADRRGVDVDALPDFTELAGQWRNFNNRPTETTESRAAAPPVPTDPMPMSALDVLYRDSAVLPKPAKKIKNAEVATILADIAQRYWGFQLNSENITPEIEQIIVANGVEEFISALRASGKNAADWYSTAIEVAMEVAGVIHPEITNAELARAIPAFSSSATPDKAAQLVMRIALAVTSQDLNVNRNAGYAEEQYGIFRRTGKFDSSKVYGEKAESISGNLELANQLITKLGFGGAEAFIQKEFSVDTLQKDASIVLGRKIKIAGKKDDLVNGAALFGPKIGQGFLQNLMGRFNPVTIDLWMRRTWGRWTGDVVGDGVTDERMAKLLDAAREDGLQIPESLRSLRTVERKRKNGESYKTMSSTVADRLDTDLDFRASVEQFAAEFNSRGQAEYLLTGQPVSPRVAASVAAGNIPYKQFIRDQQRVKDGLDRTWDRLRKAGKKPDMSKASWVAEQHREEGRTEGLDRKLRSGLKTRWSRSAKVIIGGLNPIETPSPQDRRVITRIVNKIREDLSNKGYSATNADIQAVLWYPEKDIWAKLTGEGESTLKLSYDEKFISIAEERGLGEQARAVAQRIRTNRAARTGRQDDTRTDRGVDRPVNEDRAPEEIVESRAVSRQQDTDYLAAVERGDMERVQRMVDEAARAAGYDIGPVFHGTVREFVKFSKKVFTNFRNAQSKIGFFFTPDKSYAQQYASPREEGSAGRIVSAYLRGKFKEEPRSLIEEIESDWTNQKAGSYVAKLKREGFDGVIFDGSTKEIAVFNPNQIKSADPVTRDNQGNVIPLSQRFNEASPDIRESRARGRVVRPITKNIPIGLGTKKDKDGNRIQGTISQGGIFAVDELLDKKAGDAYRSSRMAIKADVSVIQELSRLLERQMKSLYKGQTPPLETINTALGNLENPLNSQQLEEIERLFLAKKTKQASKKRDQFIRENRRRFREVTQPAALAQLPEELASTIREMSSHIESLSKRLPDEGLVNGDLAITVDEALGTYLNRSYAIFDDPEWADRVRKNAKVMDAARKYIRNSLINQKARDLFDDAAASGRVLPLADAKKMASDSVTEAEVESILEGYLAVGLEAPTVEILSGRIPGQKNLSMLTPRGNIAPEIQALWGRYEDPTVNYAKTVMKLSSVIANNQFLTELRDMGIEEGWLWSQKNSPDDLRHPPGYIRISSENNAALTPLGGMYAHPMLAEGLFKMFPVGSTDQHYWWLQSAMKLTGISMAVKTVGSVASQIRNYLGNYLNLIATGNLGLGDIASGDFKKRFANSTDTVLANTFNKYRNATRAEWRAKIDDYIRRGIVGESVTTGLLEDLLTASRKAGSPDFGDVVWNKVSEPFKKVADLAVKTYSSGDDWFKVMIYEAEQDKYRKAHPDWDDNKVKEKAAEISRDIHWTYSLAPAIVQDLKKFPFVAPFVTFTTEVIRTTYNLQKLARQEIMEGRASGNKELEAIGWKRVRGMTTAAFLPAAAGATAMALAGISGEDEEDLRRFLPDWQKNSALMLFRKENGQVSFVDISFLDPYEYFKKPLTAFMRSLREGDNANEMLLGGTMAMVRQAVDPFTSEQIFAGAIMDVMRNQDAAGRQVYNPQDTGANIGTAVARKIFIDPFTPGSFNSIERIGKAAFGVQSESGRAYGLFNELASVMAGQRVSEMDAQQALQFKGSRFMREMRDASALFNREFVSQGTRSAGDVFSGYERSNGARRALVGSIRKDYLAAIRLGVPVARAKAILRDAGIGRETLRMATTGIYKSFEASEDSLSLVRARGKNDRIAAYNQARRATPDKDVLP